MALCLNYSNMKYLSINTFIPINYSLNYEDLHHELQGFAYMYQYSCGPVEFNRIVPLLVTCQIINNKLHQSDSLFTFLIQHLEFFLTQVFPGIEKFFDMHLRRDKPYSEKLLVFTKFS